MAETINPNENLTEKGFDINPEQLLKNSVYEKLYLDSKEKMANFQNISYSSSTDKYQAYRSFLKEIDADVAKTLKNEKELFEYRYFEKFRTLKDRKLDPGAILILERFHYLPFRSLQFCTGHVKLGSNELQDNYKHLFSFSADKNINQRENELQKSFLQDIEKLNQNIADRLKVEYSDFFELKGTTFDNADGVIYQQLSAKRSFEQGYPVSFYLKVRDKESSLTRGRETLKVMWEEFYKYINEIDGKNFPIPDFGDGSIFEKSKNL